MAQAQTASAGDTGGLLTTATYKEVALATLSNITIGNEIDRQIRAFAAHLREHDASESTVRIYESHVRRFQRSAEPLFPNFDGVNRQVLLAYLNANFPANKRKPSRVTALAALRSFFRFFLTEGQISPTDGIARPRMKGRSIRLALTESQVKHLLDHAPNITLQYGRRRRQSLDYRNVAMLELLYATGIHVHELCRLDVIDVCVEVGLAHVIETRGRERVVPFGESCANALERYIQSLEKKEGALFRSARGSRIGVKDVHRIVTRYGRRLLGLPNIHPQALRVACAVHLLENFAPPIYITELLGFKSIKSTLAYLKVAIGRMSHALAYHPRTGIALQEEPGTLGPTSQAPVGETAQYPPWVHEALEPGLYRRASLVRRRPARSRQKTSKEEAGDEQY